MLEGIVIIDCGFANFVVAGVAVVFSPVVVNNVRGCIVAIADVVVGDVVLADVAILNGLVVLDVEGDNVVAVAFAIIGSEVEGSVEVDGFVVVENDTIVVVVAVGFVSTRVLCVVVSDAIDIDGDEVGDVKEGLDKDDDDTVDG